jgi:citrate lyase subunit beta / citryl-CoA lyase
MIGDARRSVLYVPGDSDKMLRRSAGISSDALLLNLEDGVSASRKDFAREAVSQALEGIDFGGREIIVRVNSLNTDIGQLDLNMAVSRRPDGLCLPKIENKDEIHSADRTILEQERLHKIPEGSIRLHAMIESSRGVLKAAEIASASPRMASLIFGSADYACDLRCRVGEDRIELLLALEAIVIACRAAGIDAIDAPCFDIRNLNLLRRESVFARRLGFDGKSALHPDQLPVINETFDVSAEEIAWAERVLAELDEAEKRGKALSTLDGSLIDNPHRTAARRIIRMKNKEDRIKKTE